MELDTSAAFKLFHYWFMVIVPQSTMYNENDTEYYGIPTSGNKQIDAEMAESDSYQSVTPAEMAHLVANGVRLTLSDPFDAARIYRIIGTHFENWRDALELRNNRVPPPIQGLYEFNKLAHLLIEIAKPHGLIELYSEPKPVNIRAYADEDVLPDIRRVNHSDALFNQIVTLAHQAGYPVRQYMIASEARQAQGDLGTDTKIVR